MDNNNNRKARELRRRRRRIIALNVLCVFLVVCGMVWVVSHFWRYTQYEITNNATVDQYITPVNIRVPGYIKRVDFREHQYVSAGDTLLMLDDREYQIHVMDAQAALADAVSALEVLEAGVRTARESVEISVAAIAQAEALLWKVEQDEKRYGDLLKQNSVSLQQYQQVQADYRAAKANCAMLGSQKTRDELQVEELITKQGNARAMIQRREADLEMSKLNLSYTVVVAPYDGYVGRRTLGEGQLVQAGQVLTNIIRDERKWVMANYKETQISNIYIGQPVNVLVDAYRGHVFRGVVSAISEATGSKYSLIPTDNAAGNFVKVQQRIPVRIELIDLSQQDNDLLRAGMMVEVEAKRR